MNVKTRDKTLPKRSASKFYPFVLYEYNVKTSRVAEMKWGCVNILINYSNNAQSTDHHYHLMPVPAASKVSV